MPRQRPGSMIGALFGPIYLLANAGDLPLAARLPLRATGGAAFLAVLARPAWPAVAIPHRGTAARGSRERPGGPVRAKPTGEHAWCRPGSP